MQKGGGTVADPDSPFAQTIDEEELKNIKGIMNETAGGSKGYRNNLKAINLGEQASFQHG